MTDVPMVAVRGEAVREVPPEIARCSVAVTARDSDPSRVLARLSERVEAVRNLIDGYGDAVERRETGHLHVAPEYRRHGERVSAYRGSASTDVVVVDFGVVGELVMRLADAEHRTVNGPWWQLRPDSPSYREVRRAAIADAVARATDYAEAVGARLAALREIADAGIAGPPVPTTRGGYGAMEMQAVAGGPPVLDLDPQVQTVYGQVEVRFTITDPAPWPGAA